jgi:hypothetical protein
LDLLGQPVMAQNLSGLLSWIWREGNLLEITTRSSIYAVELMMDVEV